MGAITGLTAPDKCAHAYVIPQGEYRYCLDCKSLIPELEFTRKYVEVVMPPQLFGITEELWKSISPWPKIPYSVVQRYAWYISMIQGLEYLVLPILRKGQPTFFSARKLSSAPGLKYTYPTGARKSPWISSDDLPEPVVICEGVADAAYTSLVASSVAILGNFYDGSLDDSLKGKRVVVALDGDAVGIYSAVGIYKHLQNLCNVSVAVFGDGKEPVDFEPDELRKELGI